MTTSKIVAYPANTALVVAVMAALFGCTPSAHVRNIKQSDIESLPLANEDVDPEEAVFKEFLLATVTADSKKLSQICVPNTEIEILLDDRQRPPPQKISSIEESLKSVPVASLRAGDRFRLPNGEVLNITSSHVNANKRQMTLPDSPFPTEIVRIDGQWKVDPHLLIEFRKKHGDRERDESNAPK